MPDRDRFRTSDRVAVRLPRTARARPGPVRGAGRMAGRGRLLARTGAREETARGSELALGPQDPADASDLQVAGELADLDRVLSGGHPARRAHDEAALVRGVCVQPHAAERVAAQARDV